VRRAHAFRRSTAAFIELRLALACSRTALESFTEMMLGRPLLVAAGQAGFARVQGCNP
jgi:hypothetical protein